VIVKHASTSDSLAEYGVETSNRQRVLKIEHDTVPHALIPVGKYRTGTVVARTLFVCAPVLW
jgi:hypothetical protein